MNEVLKELRELEQFGPLALELLCRLAESELRRIPELRHDHSKTHEDYALDFFAKSGEALLAAAILQAQDDDAVGRMFRTWLRRWMIDKARQGARGRLREVLRKRLDRDQRFEKVRGTSFWRLAEGPSEASGADPADLIDAAWQCHVSFAAPRKADAQQVRLGRQGELENLLSAVFKAAAGSLSEEALATIVAVRLPYQTAPVLSSLDELAPQASAAPAPETQVIAAVDTAEARGAADRVLAALTEVERALVPVIDDWTAASKILGKKRSATYNRLDRLIVKLKELAGSEPAAHEILEIVVQRCLEGADVSASRADGPASVPSTSVER
ncbi:hypothetical protein LO763_10015 [Glycomyces sp. A-F 0318]|uniref:hypothetical protein n=1 Tax=Glycomyces amatae TaxID=2881355 RepID=UPI001E2AC2B1|nr:hypothetical protein [Glycomyces amatae]MCD0443958.1 hypothetical protein [Glycomyces amatae]